MSRSEICDGAAARFGLLGVDRFVVFPLVYEGVVTLLPARVRFRSLIKRIGRGRHSVRRGSNALLKWTCVHGIALLSGASSLLVGPAILAANRSLALDRSVGKGGMKQRLSD